MAETHPADCESGRILIYWPLFTALTCVWPWHITIGNPQQVLLRRFIIVTLWKKKRGENKGRWAREKGEVSSGGGWGLQAAALWSSTINILVPCSFYRNKFPQPDVTWLLNTSVRSCCWEQKVLEHETGVVRGPGLGPACVPAQPWKTACEIPNKNPAG